MTARHAAVFALTVVLVAHAATADETAADISCDGKPLVVRYRGWTCRYTTDGALADTGAVCCNRNGRYRAFEARGEKSLSVRVSIEDSTNNKETTK